MTNSDYTEPFISKIVFLLTREIKVDSILSDFIAAHQNILTFFSSSQNNQNSS